MNTIVARYAFNLPARDRVQLVALWNRLERKVTEDDERLYGPLPNFGRVAIAFTREMQKQGINPVGTEHLQPHKQGVLR